jgi:hypothetical protein
LQEGPPNQHLGQGTANRHFPSSTPDPVSDHYIFGSQVGGYRREVDQEKLGPALLITAGLILGMRTIRWEATHSDGLAGEEWEKEVEHSARVAKRMLTFLTTRYPDLFQSQKVPWYVATDEDSPK